MFSITVAEASAKLGVSPARVRQLIKSGVLAAEQVAGIWLIDEKSVEARREHLMVAVHEQVTGDVWLAQARAWSAATGVVLAACLDGRISRCR